MKSHSVSLISAGFITVLVGLTSSLPIVFQAAGTLNISSLELSSWIWALQMGMGVTCIALSLKYRVPVVTAFSTTGAALLVTALSGLTLPEAIGAFLISGTLLALSGMTGWFEKIMDRVPLSIASAMLAGILARFGMHAFAAMEVQLPLVLGMALAYLLLKRWLPRYTILLVLLLGTGIALSQGLVHGEAIAFGLTLPIFTAPEFTWRAAIGVALPLFFVTTAGQNAAGVAVIRAHGYDNAVSPLITVTGITNILLAPFGGFAFNLAAISAAICMGEEAHPDPQKRYLAAIWAGIFHLVVGFFGLTLASLFNALPKEMIIAIAGLALLGTIGNSLAAAMKDERQREAALITFLITASGLTLYGIGSAFWGLVGGALAGIIFSWRKAKVQEQRREKA